MLSKIKLQTWFLAIYFITNHKKGIASSQLAKDLKVTQNATQDKKLFCR